MFFAIYVEAELPISWLNISISFAAGRSIEMWNLITVEMFLHWSQNLKLFVVWTSFFTSFSLLYRMFTSWLQPTKIWAEKENATLARKGSQFLPCRIKKKGNALQFSVKNQKLISFSFLIWCSIWLPKALVAKETKN